MNNYKKYILSAIACIIVMCFPDTLFAQSGAISKASKKVFGKIIGKEVVEKSTKEVAGELAEKAVARNVAKTYAIKRGAIRELNVTPAFERKFSREFQEEFIEDAAQKAVTKSFNAVAATQAGKAVAKPITREAIESGAILAEKKELVLYSQNSVKKNFTREAESVIAKKEGRLIAVETAEDLLKELELTLGKRGAETWEKVCAKESIESSTKQLLRDLASNSVLKRAFKRNPELLKAYSQLIESAYRTDLTMLRYINFGAGKYGRMMPKLGSAWGFGEDLIIKTENGVNRIYNSANDFLGTISGNSASGYVIECSMTNRTLLNIFPMKNATYKCGNNLWKTDDYGRVIYARSLQKGKVDKVVSRDNNIQRDVVALKNNYSVNGDMLNNGHLHADDEGGHIIALQNGGSNDLINFFPQSPKSNRNMDAFTLREQAWYNSERTANKALNKGSSVEREVFLDYGDKTSMRPTKMRLTQRIDGKIETLKGNKYGGPVALDNLEILNN